MKNPLTKYQKDKICQEYSTGNYTCTELAKYYPVSRAAVYRLIKKRNVKINGQKYRYKRKYKFNEEYFDKIDTEDKAYFLGLLYADGYNGMKSNVITIQLQEDDKHILEDFERYIGLDKPLKYIKPRGNRKVHYRLDIYSMYMCNSLTNKGCHQNKSNTLKFPNEEMVDKSLYKHFIRGYMDGDGYIGINGAWNITGTKYICEFVKNILDDMNIHSYIETKNNHRITRMLRTGGRGQVIKLLDWLYKDASVFLKRKYNIYKQMKIDYSKSLTRPKAIIQKTLNGDFINTWKSSYDIQNELGIHSGSISRIVNNNRAFHGYIWESA